MTPDLSKGAEWRKWDLHVHTPASIYQKFGENNNDTWEQYIEDLENLSQDFSVVGINDYLFINGYEKLKEKQAEGRLQNIKLLPVVEFRIEKFAGINFGNLKRMNLHVFFSDEVSTETIRSQFLNTLEQSYSLESGDEWSRAITPESVAELGKSIKSAVPEEQLSKYGSDLVEGFNNLNVKEEQIFKSLNKDCFKNKYLIAIGKTEWADLKWTDASIATKKSIINKADIVFTSSESVDKFNSSKNHLTQQGVNDFLLDCSDAHYLSTSEDKDRIGKCFTWLKADPTFEGLLQVINEPEERVYIGDKPPLLDKIAKNRTKYIKKISIDKLADYNGSQGTWFDNIQIPLNSELVAIIGNKGSGKSAIADIISLCSNYHDDNDFSFLTKRKFRDKGGRIAKNFKATVRWESGVSHSKALSESPDDTEVLSVKYLPQGQFEKLTNEIDTVEKFQKEIESVVFSHIPESERLGKITFDQLIEAQSSAVESAISHLRDDIVNINKHILGLEVKSTPAYKAELQNKLDKKREELKALIEPTVVSDPNDDPEKQIKSASINAKITTIKSDIKALEDRVAFAEEQKAKALVNKQKLESSKNSIVQKNTEFERFVEEQKNSLADFEIDFEKLISFKYDFSEIDQLIRKENTDLESAKKLLGEVEIEDATYQNLREQLSAKSEDLKIETAKLDSEQKQFQAYLHAKEVWEKDCAKVIGTDDTPETIKFFEKELRYLEETLQLDLDTKYEERRSVVRDIFKQKEKVIQAYKVAKNRLNEIIEENSDTLKEYKISVDASLVKKVDFNEKFLSYILQNKSGSFHSKEGGESQLNRIITEIDFDNVDDVLRLLDGLVEALHKDQRPDHLNTVRIATDQVNDIYGLYNYLFSLEFLDKNYQLKQGDKTLEQLSPGERGALLLVFYLLLDKSDIPLIIDQPEDNLDNHSVATVLVPFIRAAKKKRQIIMVTHNPNLAVVADAEQVIYVNLDKDNDYKFSTISGSIENRDVNKKIVEVLEGAMLAFNARKKKYYE